MFTLCVALLSTGISRAQSSLVLNAKDGSAENVELAKKPVVTFGAYGDKVTVTCDGQTRTIDLKDLQASGVDAESNELVILKFDNQQPVAFKLSTLLSIVQEDETDQLLPHLIATDPSVSIYRQALEQTGLIDSLSHHVDMTYTVGADSTGWDNRQLITQIAAEYENVAYMPRRYYKFTALLVKDEVLAEKYGITDIDGLRRKAHEIYDAVYPEDASVTDETDRRNALNRFISYHLLPFLGEYYKLTSIDGGLNTLAKNFLRDQADISDWYETMMPYSIMKFSFPKASESGLYVNRRGIQSRPDNMGIKIRGAKVTPPNEMEIENSCVNGVYHYIDDIVAYDQTMQQLVCNDRMRIDCTTLSPDFMTSGARGHYTRSSVEDGKYGQWDSRSDITNTSICLGFKSGAAKNFKFNDNNTHLHVSPRYLNFWSYQGDEVIIQGPYDFTVKLPPVPAGKYELRMGVTTNFPSNGLINIYIDDELKCEQLDTRPQIPYDPEGAPYYYTEERNAVDWDKGRRVTLYTPHGQLVWLTDAALEEAEQANYSDQAWENYLAELKEAKGEEWVAEHMDEVHADYEDRAYNAYISLKRGNQSDEQKRYKALHDMWKQAQDNPDQYTFKGDEPLDPSSEEMTAWYESTVDKAELLRLGFKAYYHKKLHDKGWMRGPASYSPSASETNTFADLYRVPRKVIGTFTTDGKSDHFLRLQQLSRESYTSCLHFDYIELIPVDAVATEDKY
jgi:hypothetical protein